MLMPRAIPCLLLLNRGLVKTRRFRNPTYLGDPINIVKIFNDKEVDEIVLLDITATVEGRPPQFDLVHEIAQEAFMPVAYGGGIRTIEDVRRLLNLGVEKVVINTSAVERPEFIQDVSRYAGNQSVVVSIDVKRRWWRGMELVTRSGRRRTGIEPAVFARTAEGLGAGELLLTSVDRDGTMDGYDLELIRSVTATVTIPVVAAGGARDVTDLRAAVIDAGAAAAGAGAMFVFKGPHRAVLISYPAADELRRAFVAS